MKKMLIVIVVMLFFSSLYAEENANLKTEEKIDSIYVLQKKIYRTVKDQPLQDKRKWKLHSLSSTLIQLLNGMMNI